jgi:dihydrofolate reductase
MGKVILGMSMSLDGFINDRSGDVGRLYSDFDTLRETETLQEAMRDTGAVVMGRHAYDMAQGDFTGYEFQTPIFVVTHKAPDTVAKGQNDKLKFSFVGEGNESAVAQAQAAAGDKDVTIVGGASVAQQCIKQGLVDELQISIVPILLGDGLRFFENLGDEPIELEVTRVSENPGRTDLWYRVVKPL